MLEYCGSAFEGLAVDEHFVAPNADDGFSNCCIKSVDYLLSGIFVIEWHLVFVKIKVLELYGSKCERSGMPLP